MQFIKTILTITLFILPFIGYTQSTMLPQQHKHQQLLDRLEIKMRTNSDLNLSTSKPLSRRIAVRAVMAADSMAQQDPGMLTNVDKAGIRSFYMNNSEWYTGDAGDFKSRKTFLNAFYPTKANMIEVNNEDFFLAVNPVIQFEGSKETDNDDQVFLNQKGLAIRGLIAKKVGFSALLTDNQERAPSYVMEYIVRNNAVPGFGFYKYTKNRSVDYFDARGSINFTAAKYIDISFGYDKQFIGNGYRSLFLSDFSNSHLFLKLNTRIWKLNYQSTTMELVPQFNRRSADVLYDKKYATMHHLSVNATKWLTLGLFETVIYGRKNTLELSYLNPVIFLRAAEHQNGSEDNAIVGFDLKANVAKKLQVYGQLLMDEFKFSEVTGGEGWWANKFGFQGGGKYIDAFGITNLDLQGELNFVRPFTYSHIDTVANFTHNNQPMAHPFGANFKEFIAIARYKPHPKWNASARLIYWTQGVDTANMNFGSDVRKPYTTRPFDYGYTIGSGAKGTGINAQFLLTWEPKENLFIDLSAMVRRYEVNELNISKNSTMATIGVRMNIMRREYDY